MRFIVSVAFATCFSSDLNVEYTTVRCHCGVHSTVVLLLVRVDARHQAPTIKKKEQVGTNHVPLKAVGERALIP